MIKVSFQCLETEYFVLQRFVIQDVSKMKVLCVYSINASVHLDCKTMPSVKLVNLLHIREEINKRE